MTRTKLFIEADSIIPKKMSGIGKSTVAILHELDSSTLPDVAVTAIVPFGKKTAIQTRYGFRNIQIRELPPGGRYVNALMTRVRWSMPVDWIFGRGIYVFPNYKNWLLSNKSRSITFVDDVAYRMFPETVLPKNRQYLELYVPLWTRRANMVATLSAQSASEILGYYPSLRNKLAVVPFGVDKNIYKPYAQDDMEVLIRRLGLRDDKYFVSIGNIEPRKNLAQALEAYKMYSDAIGKENAASMLLVGGDGWNNDDIIEKINTLASEGYAILRPGEYLSDADVARILSGALALVQVSLHEGFGLTPLEALACGTPVVVSDIPVFQETLKGLVGVTFATDTNHVSRALINLNTKRQLPAQCPYTWSNTIEKIIDIIGVWKREKTR